jgi:hypothetical protein
MGYIGMERGVGTGRREEQREWGREREEGYDLC